MTLLGSLIAFSALVACSREDDKARPKPAGSSEVVAEASAASPPFATPRLLFLPDAGDQAPPEAPLSLLAPPVPATGACPPEMVLVNSGFCIDRYETSLQDARSGRLLSPYYHPEPSLVRSNYERWRRHSDRSSTALALRLEVPKPPEWQLSEPFDILATSKGGSIPSGYLNLEKANRACANAGKRLCTHEQWVTACRSERNTKFPYGNRYIEGHCNIFRDAHPAALLHGNASLHHLDPRLNLTRARGKPLLQPTGAAANCASRWGNDAIYDMVGNLDEWVDDPSGKFVGGFFSRATKEGCDASIASHAPEYFDYSLGTRCCQQL